MKPHKIREFSDEELRQKEEELTEQLFKLRFQTATGQMDNPQKLKLVRRDIARIKTVKRERQLKKEPQAKEPREKDKEIHKRKK